MGRPVSPGGARLNFNVRTRRRLYAELFAWAREQRRSGSQVAESFLGYAPISAIEKGLTFSEIADAVDERWPPPESQAMLVAEGPPPYEPDRPQTRGRRKARPAAGT